MARPAATAAAVRDAPPWRRVRLAGTVPAPAARRCPLDHLHHVREESRRLLDVAVHGDPQAPVTSCPGWTVTDLLGHVGVVQRFHGGHLDRGTTEPPTAPRPTPPDEGLAGWVADGTAALLDALARLGRDAPAWNFAGAQPMTTAFWHRRMALEAAVHRWDVEEARGVAGTVDPALAVSGIEEVAEVWIPLRRSRAAGDGAPTGAVRLEVTDVGEIRTALVGEASAGAGADAVLRGPAQRLLLVLWGRLPLDAVEVEGDRTVAGAVRAG